MAGANPRSHRALGTGRSALTSDGGYAKGVRQEKKSWDRLAQARDDWLVDDARRWYVRLCTGPALGDLKVEKVKLYVGALLARGA